MQSEFKAVAEKTRAYLNYVEEHYDNVQRAWAVIKEKCFDMWFVAEDEYRSVLDAQVLRHDLSKLSANEFVQYRAWFFPTEFEAAEKDIRKAGFDAGWESHKLSNSHHWQNWTKYVDMGQPKDQELNAVHMVIDWVAMSYNFGGSASIYYETNKDRIDIPFDWAEELIYDIFARVEEDVFIAEEDGRYEIAAGAGLRE
jgi:hypothetical protein